MDAGEVGAGHRVTALYEITLAGQPSRIEPLRYGAAPAGAGESASRSEAGGGEGQGQPAKPALAVGDQPTVSDEQAATSAGTLTAATATTTSETTTEFASATAAAIEIRSELAFLKLRYKLPGQTTSTLVSQAIATPTGQESASERLRFAAAAAAFGQYLRGGTALNGFTLADIVTLASGAKGGDASGYRAEFIGLVKLAQALPGA